MLPIVQSEMATLLENIRLLETLVTTQLGLHSDIKMLRQSLQNKVDSAIYLQLKKQ